MLTRWIMTNKGDPARTQETGELNWSLMTFHLDFTWTIVIIIIISSHKHICRDHVDLIKHKSNSATVRFYTSFGSQIFCILWQKFPQTSYPPAYLKPSSPDIILTEMTIGLQRHQRLHITVTLSYQWVRLPMTRSRMSGHNDDGPRCHYPLTRRL